MHGENNYPISALCKLGKVARAGYYKWLHRGISANEQENMLIGEKIEEIHQRILIKGIAESAMIWNAIMISM